MTPVFLSDTQTSQTIANELKAYFDTHVLNGGNFICGRREACKTSSNARYFYEGQLHHVGRHYDLTRDGRPWRVVVCGQEYGHPPGHWSMEERYRQIAEGSGRESRFTSTPGFRTRNPHMKGTTSLLRLWFGLGLGKDHQGEFIRVNNETVHIFDAFSLVNFLVCSATDGGKKGKSTDTMQNNCREHFEQTINILKPSVLVCQGDRVSQWVRRTFDITPSGLHEGTIRTLGTRVIEFSHPAAWGEKNWGWNDNTPYLLDTVEPTVTRVRNNMASEQ
jgi:hypothetical protein